MNEYKKGYEDGYNAGKEDLTMLHTKIKYLEYVVKCRDDEYSELNAKITELKEVLENREEFIDWVFEHRQEVITDYLMRK